MWSTGMHGALEVFLSVEHSRYYSALSTGGIPQCGALEVFLGVEHLRYYSVWGT